MRIGLDLDNTIVCYDRVFYALGREEGLSEEILTRGKLGIRNFLRQHGREHEWTIMQGVAYGPRMKDASPFAGVLEFIGQAKALGHELSVVSHRTKYPYLGEAHDLHGAALKWLDAAGINGHASVFLEEKVEDKAARISSLCCEVFVDDLPEFLARPDLPVDVRKVHFAPDADVESSEFESARNWRGIAALILEK